MGLIKYFVCLDHTFWSRKPSRSFTVSDDLDCIL